jgi:pyridoxine kinase
MTRILALSSQVVRGHVGLSAICPVLTILGIDTLAMPTAMMSNHPGHRHSANALVAVKDLRAMIAALQANNWLDVDAILTGYLPTADHVAFAIDTIDLVKRVNPNRAIQIICDPVIGDDPKGCYIDAAAAEAIRVHLVPRASIVTPNRFELSYLAQSDVRSCANTIAAARRLHVPITVATSITDPTHGTVNMCVTPDDTYIAQFAARPIAPNGTGDTFAAVFCAHHIARSAPLDVALGRATGTLTSLITASTGQSELAIISAQSQWRDAPSAEVTHWSSEQ